MSKSLLTTQEAAEFLGIKPDTVRAHMQRGLLGGKRLGRTYVFEEDDLKRFKKAKRGAGRPPTLLRLFIQERGLHEHASAFVAFVRQYADQHAPQNSPDGGKRYFRLTRDLLEDLHGEFERTRHENA